MSEKLIYTILELITVIFETFIVQQYIDGFFDKCVKTRRTFFGYLLFCIGLAILGLVYRQPIVLACYTVVGVFTLEFFLYNGNTFTKFFLSFFFGILMIASDIICVGIMSDIWKINLEDTYEYGLHRALAISIVKIVQILTVKILGIIVKWRVSPNDKMEIKGAFYLIICQVFSIILSYNIFMTAYNTGGRLTTSVLFSITGIMYMNLIVFWYFDIIKSSYEYKHEKDLAETKLKFQKKYYKLLDERQQETEALWHDIKKHMSAIKELYERDLKVNAEQYINDLEYKVNSIPKIVRTSIPAINAIIVDELHKAAKEKIDVKLDINILQEIKINDFDICILLGNTIENAINACSVLPSGIERYINISILQNDCLLLIDIENPFISTNNKVPKNDRKHGYGLKNVHKVIQKYGGEIKINDINNLFHVSILIP